MTPELGPVDDVTACESELEEDADEELMAVREAWLTVTLEEGPLPNPDWSLDSDLEVFLWPRFMILLNIVFVFVILRARIENGYSKPNEK